MKILLLLGFAAACGGAPGPAPVARAWPAQGTTMSAAAWGPDTARIARALDAVRDTIDRPGRARALDKGDALDRAASILGGVVDSALLDLGGQYRWVGARDTRRVVGIADPANSLDAIATVELRSGSVSTSFHQGGTASVTVLAPTAALADTWSTALLDMGCDRALAMGPQLRAANVSIVCGDSGRVRWSPDLAGRVQVPTRP